MVHRLAADHADCAAFQAHRFPEQHARVDAADRLKAQEAVVGDMGNKEGDLIHVREQRDLVFRALCALFFDKDIAERVNGIRCVCGEVFEHEVAHRVLAPGGCVKHAKRFQHSSVASRKINSESSRAEFSTSAALTTSTPVCI